MSLLSYFNYRKLNYPKYSYIMALNIMVNESMLTSDVDSTEPRRQIWGPWSTTGFGLVVIVISIIVQAIISFVFIMAELITTATSDLDEFEFLEWLETLDLGLVLSLSIIISAVVGVGLIIIIIKVRKGLTITQYLGLRSVSIRAIFFSLAVSVGFLVLSSLVSLFFETPADSDIMLKAYESSVWPALFWIAVVVFAPVFEEILFRGFLFEGFRHSRIGVVGTIIVTSLVWAGFHLQYGLLDIASIFVLGVLFGIVRHMTGSLWAPMLMHAFHNLVVTMMVAISLS